MLFRSDSRITAVDSSLMLSLNINDIIDIDGLAVSRYYDEIQLLVDNTNQIKKRNNKDYTIIFNSGGITKINGQVTVKDGKVQIPINEPVKEGFIFIGWYYNNKLFDFNTKISKDITLVAKWEKK